MTFALKIFDVVFALDGDTAAVPDSPPGDGSVSYLTGYGVDYQLDLSTDPSALPVGRQQFNQILQDATGAIQQIQQAGYTPWSSLLTPYPQYAVVIYSGNVYQSVVGSNNSTPGTDANWVVSDTSSIVTDLVTNGYAKFPGGLIIQWGQFTTSNGGYTNWTYPITFPNAALAILGTLNNNTAFNVSVDVDLAHATTSHVGVANLDTAGTANYHAFPNSMFAIGW